MISTTPVYHWTRKKYEAMIEAGILTTEDRVELIDGMIVSMPPQNSYHAGMIEVIEDELRTICGAGYAIRVQMPLALDDRSEPEPDLAVVKGRPREHLEAHPTTALLIIEVSDATLRTDQTTKKTLYARNFIPEYWIVSLPDKRLEVYRDPQGETYQTEQLLTRGDVIQPLFCDAKIAWPS